MKKLIGLIVALFFIAGCGGGSSNSYYSHIDNNKVKVNDVEKFCIDMNNFNCTNSINLTAKKIINVQDRRLIIWVAQDEYNSGKITDDMLNNLANEFLQDGNDNDIYDWDTNIHGKEWGADAQNSNSKLIGFDKTIHLALFDFADKYNNSKYNRVAGFYWKKDNFKTSAVPASNEKIMVYINSYIYRKNEKEVYTTLVHEFTHLINFYQREIKIGIDDATWFKEFLAETTENLVKDKLNYDTNDRYNQFNGDNYWPVTKYVDQDIRPYSSVHTFGAFLLRNYGGAKLLHNISLNPNSNEQAIIGATNSDFNTILQNFASAYLISNLKDPQLNQIITDTPKDTHTFNVGANGVTIIKIPNSQSTSIKLNLEDYKDVYVASISHSDQEIKVSSPQMQDFRLSNLNKQNRVFSNKINYKNIVNKVSYFNNIQVKQFLNLKHKKIANKRLVKLLRATNNEKLYKFNYEEPIESQYNSIIYQLDPVNFYNLDEKPKFNSDLNLYKDGILFTKIGNDLNDEVDINVTMDDKADIVIVAK